MIPTYEVKMAKTQSYMKELLNNTCNQSWTSAQKGVDQLIIWLVGG